MRGIRLFAVSYALLGALLAPAMLFAADDQPRRVETAPQTTTPETTTPETTTTPASAPPASEPQRTTPSATLAQPPAEPRARAARRPVARAAAAATIRDFSFVPRSLTINQGETVTWRNNGPSVHTATARDGSFDTGNLARGQTGSHTFNRAGTFSYFCRPHPSMTATITVRGTGGGGGGASGSAPSDDGSGGTGSGESAEVVEDGADAGAGSDGDDRDLANTGIHVAWVAWFGALLLALGVGLRWDQRGRP